jgi:hypothetical protein
LCSSDCAASFAKQVAKLTSRTSENYDVLTTDKEAMELIRSVDRVAIEAKGNSSARKPNKRPRPDVPNDESGNEDDALQHDSSSSSASDNESVLHEDGYDDEAVEPKQTALTTPNRSDKIHVALKVAESKVTESSAVNKANADFDLPKKVEKKGPVQGLVDLIGGMLSRRDLTSQDKEKEPASRTVNFHDGSKKLETLVDQTTTITMQVAPSPLQTPSPLQIAMNRINKLVSDVAMKGTLLK